MADDGRLAEHDWYRLERIAMKVARVSRVTTRPGFGLWERYDAALDAVVDWVADHGFPAPHDDIKPLAAAADNAIQRAAYHLRLDFRHANFWLPAPGNPDHLAEDVTERLAVHQLCYEFTGAEWEAIAALAYAIGCGEDSRWAAQQIGIDPGTFKARIHAARKRARALWVAPGETPRGHYQPMGAHPSSLHVTLKGRRQRDRRREAA